MRFDFVDRDSTRGARRFAQFPPEREQGRARRQVVRPVDTDVFGGTLTSTA